MRTLVCYVNKIKPCTRETVQSVPGCASSRTSSLALKGAPGRVLYPCNLSVEEWKWWERGYTRGSPELTGQPGQRNQEAWGLVRDPAFNNEGESD